MSQPEVVVITGASAGSRSQAIMAFTATSIDARVIDRISFGRRHSAIG